MFRFRGCMFMGLSFHSQRNTFNDRVVKMKRVLPKDAGVM